MTKNFKTLCVCECKVITKLIKKWPMYNVLIKHGFMCNIYGGYIVGDQQLCSPT